MPTPGDGTNPTPGGAEYFYQIVERYSHVIAAVFFGHTHEDQAFIYYSNNGTNQSADSAIANAWVGPSLTPLTNLNSGQVSPYSIIFYLVGCALTLIPNVQIQDV
jgi:hypothetical protein